MGQSEVYSSSTADEVFADQVVVLSQLVMHWYGSYPVQCVSSYAR